MRSHLNPRRAALVVAMLAVTPLAGCGDAGDEEAQSPALEAIGAPDSAALDGIAFEVHRDPG